MDRTGHAVEPPLGLSKLVADSPDGAGLLQSPCDNAICKLSYNGDVKCIEVVWRKYATSPQLRYVHEIMLLMLVQHNVSKILGDHSRLPIIHGEDQRWIVEQWLPRAKAAGFEAAAFVISMTYFGRVATRAIQSTLAREVELRNFHSIQSARGWLRDATAISAG